jgi:hypothetical protein
MFFEHLHAFFFSIGMLAVAGLILAHIWPALQGAADALVTLLFWVGVVYALLAVRRVFAKSWKGAAFKTVLLACAYVVVFSITIAGVYLYAIFQL